MTTVTVTSTNLRLNNGQPVPDGTMFTVRMSTPDSSSKAVPFGTILSADEDPLTNGVQVSAHSGAIQFTAELPGTSGSASAFAHSVAGTAVGRQAIAYAPPK